MKHIVRARTRVNATHSAPPPPSVSAMRVACGLDDDNPMAVALVISE